ncbi:srr1 protein [Cyclospora cayetanensis]|uniref:Srr1 protein n=1 Tax=Cyclospora cayetanensis TaxID=88456 RepID=A0A1D3D6H8_9EIME|nr:srr1 protein [Cyclospora cayetanensis]
MADEGEWQFVSRGGRGKGHGPRANRNCNATRLGSFLAPGSLQGCSLENSNQRFPCPSPKDAGEEAAVEAGVVRAVQRLTEELGASAFWEEVLHQLQAALREELRCLLASSSSSAPECESGSNNTPGVPGSPASSLALAPPYVSPMPESPTAAASADLGRPGLPNSPKAKAVRRRREAHDGLLGGAEDREASGEGLDESEEAAPSRRRQSYAEEAENEDEEETEADGEIAVYLAPHCDVDLYGEILGAEMQLHGFCTRCFSCAQFRDVASAEAEGPTRAAAQREATAASAMEEHALEPTAEGASAEHAAGEATGAERGHGATAAGAVAGSATEGKDGYACCSSRREASRWTCPDVCRRKRGFVLIGNALSSYELRRHLFGDLRFVSAAWRFPRRHCDASSTPGSLAEGGATDTALGAGVADGARASASGQGSHPMPSQAGDSNGDYLACLSHPEKPSSRPVQGGPQEVTCGQQRPGVVVWKTPHETSRSEACGETATSSAAAEPRLSNSCDTPSGSSNTGSGDTAACPEGLCVQVTPARWALVLFELLPHVSELPLQCSFSPHPRAFNDLAVCRFETPRTEEQRRAFWKAAMQQSQQAAAADARPQKSHRGKARGVDGRGVRQVVLLSGEGVSEHTTGVGGRGGGKERARDDLLFQGRRQRALDLLSLRLVSDHQGVQMLRASDLELGYMSACRGRSKGLSLWPPDAPQDDNFAGILAPRGLEELPNIANLTGHRRRHLKQAHA